MSRRRHANNKIAKNVIKTVLRMGAMVGAGAVTGVCIRNHDLSGLKGIGKFCAGLGIIGISHAAGNIAADAIEKDVDNVYDAAEYVSNMFLSDEDEDDRESVKMEGVSPAI